MKVCFPTGGVEYKYSEEDTIKDKEFVHRRFHEVQKKVVNFSLQNGLPVSLIQGPPGTGKSLVIKEMILQCLKRGEKVLVTAFSNAAVDNLANVIVNIKNELESFQIFSLEQFIRVGRSVKMKPMAKEISVEEKENKSFFKMCLNKMEKCTYTKEDQVLVYERKEELENKLNTYREILMEKAGVIFATCVSSGSYEMRKFFESRKSYFDLVIIDEASQALEAACWIPMLLGKKVVIVGDFQQIGPIILSNQSKDFADTIFEKLYKLHKGKIDILLSIQFRMNEKIMKFPSEYFYGGQLVADSSVADRLLRDKFPANYTKDPLDLFIEPLIFVNTQGVSIEKKNSSTKYNSGEAEIVEWFVNYLIKWGVKENDIGVITPYSGQVAYINKILQNKIEVSTVDGFQGSEKEIIIISFVRSNDYKEIGFLADKKRINVSLTRPKKMLVIICDGDTLNGSDFLKEMVSFYKKYSKILDIGTIAKNI